MAKAELTAGVEVIDLDGAEIITKGTKQVKPHLRGGGKVFVKGYTQRGRPALTPEVAHGVGTDAGNRAMREGGRTAWSEEDYNAAAQQRNRLTSMMRDEGDDDDGEDGVPSCPACGGPGGELGTLGKLQHFRCRNCGMDFNREAGKSVGYADVGPHVAGGHAVRGYRQRRRPQFGTRRPKGGIPASYSEARAFVGGRLERRGPRGHHASLYRYGEATGDQDVRYKLHETDVVTYHADDAMTLRTGGWQTTSTKAHLNEALRGRGSIGSVKGQWMYYPQSSPNAPNHPGREVPFSEGMRIDAHGNIVNQGASKGVVLKSVETIEGIAGILLHLEEHGIDDVADHLTPAEAGILVMATKSATAAQQAKIHEVMHEHKHGTLHSGTGKPGKKRKAKVTDRRQAVAIALSEAGLSKKSVRLTVG